MASGWQIGAGCGRSQILTVWGFVLSVVSWLLMGNGLATAAVSRTPNFVVTAAFVDSSRKVPFPHPFGSYHQAPHWTH